VSVHWRCLFWVQSLLGSGHLRRALLLAEAFAARGGEVTLANGGSPGPWAPAPRVRLVQLPPISARNGDFGDLVDASGSPVTSALRIERQQTLTSLLAMHPQVIVTEMFPFGRRAFRGELAPVLQAARSLPRRPLVIASVRDILVSKRDPSRYDFMVQTCLEHYDQVLVHGDERLLPFASSFPPAAELGSRIVHTGFVHQRAQALEVALAPAVLISAGGGAVGRELLAAALAARPSTRFATAPWLLVGGQNLPTAAFAALQECLPSDCSLERYRSDLPALMGQCEVSVSQAGYNSVVEGLAAEARMVLVPFATGEEDEQEQRARRLVELGLAERVAESELSGAKLAQAIDRAGGTARPLSTGWSFDGAARSADIVAGLIRKRFGDG
jgi:predicted glycosyltransferase